MKKINDYRKLFGVDAATSLSELKTIYRNFMKLYHPDKFAEESEAKADAEEKSRDIIEAYHFLVSIAPETIESSLPEFKETVCTSNISDYQYKGEVLEICFVNGSSYEFFNVPRNTYIKLINADSPARFAKRHIYTEFLYRKAANMEMA
jgi:hypothetical protein